eukprot:PhF_6_TR29729/c0_g1_i1/m.43760
MSVVTKCDECRRSNIECIPDSKDGKLYCRRCWADFLIASNLFCYLCKRSVASVRDVAASNNVCRKCYRETLCGGKTKQRALHSHQPPPQQQPQQPPSQQSSSKQTTRKQQQDQQPFNTSSTGTGDAAWGFVAISTAVAVGIIVGIAVIQIVNRSA